MPDLDLGNREVTAELDAIADFWLGEMGVDGFRIDAARHLFEDDHRLENVDATFSWLSGFRERVKVRHPEALILGEVWDASSMSARYVRDGALHLTFNRAGCLLSRAGRNGPIGPQQAVGSVPTDGAGSPARIAARGGRVGTVVWRVAPDSDVARPRSQRRLPATSLRSGGTGPVEPRMMSRVSSRRCSGLA